MKTTSRILAAWMVVGLSFGVSTRTWAAPPATSSIWVALAATGEAPLAADSPEMTRLKVVDLCKRARQAMNEGNFETADSFVSRAEALHANFGVIYFGDSPKKVRRDLERMRPAKAAPAQAAPAKKPSEKFTPQTVNDADKQADEPHQQARASASAAAAKADENGPAVPINDNRGYAKNYLNKSRAELAQGNLNGAVFWYQKAAQAGAQFTADEDSPQKLAADLVKAGARLPAAGDMVAEEAPPASSPQTGRSRFPERSPFARTPPQEPPASDIKPNFTERTDQHPDALSASPLPAASAAYPIAPTSGAQQRAQCDGLLLAARRALSVGDVRRATDALNQAKALGVKYEFHEDSPAKVEAAIYKFNELVQRPAGEHNSESYRRRYAELQMQQAEDLLRWRDFDEAERLVTEAKRMGLNYGPFESNPDVLLGRIAEGRKHAPATHVQPLPPLEATAGATADGNATGAGTPAKTAADAGRGAAVLAAKKAKSLELVRQAREAMRHGDLDQAAVLAQSAQELGVPDSAFGPRDDRPFLVLLKIQGERRHAVTPAQAVMPIATTGESAAGGAMQAVYDSAHDTTANVTASSQESVNPSNITPLPGQDPGGAAVPAGDSAPTSLGMSLFQQGEDALRHHDLKTAMGFFRQAQAHRDQLDPTTQQRLQDHLQLGAQLPAPGHPGSEGSLMKDAAAAEQVKYRQLSLEISRLENQAKQQQEKDPKRAKATLEEARALVAKAQLETSLRDLLERRVSRDLSELDTYMNANRGRIELGERNDAVRSQIDHEQKHKVEVQEKLALLVDEYNGLVDQKRYEEAEVVAKRAFELAPKEPVVVQLKQQSLVLRRLRNNADVKAASEEGVWQNLHNVEVAAVPPDDSRPYQFPNVTDWEKLTLNRSKLKAMGRAKRSEKEMEIEHRLKTPVSVRFKDIPLAQVLDNLAKLARINLYLDQRGLSEEGVSTDTPVTIDLSEEISLKSALALILEPLHLSYVIKDEVLKITSEQMRDGEVYTVTYNVADLVIPIPNFVPNGHMGLQGALDDAHRSLGVGGTLGIGQAPLAVMASRDGAPNHAMMDPNVLAQFNVPNPTGGMGGGGMGGGGMGGNPMTGMSQPFGFGPGGAGGGVQPDFESLIELITGTIAPTTWSEVGGQGAIKQFATNLSLVISQTQEVHEEIADLLEQLRRLQDLQVTIEVRFIELSDIFYEQMGIDMDLGLPSNANQAGAFFGTPLTTNNTNGNGSPVQYDSNGNIVGTLSNFGTLPSTPNTSVTVGLSNAFSPSSPPLFTSDLSIPLTQTSFGLTQPSNQLFQYAGAGMAGGATLGFAILSDIQAYFFMQAVQSDSRTNLLQAPKVTLFNGQQAFVSDTAQSPFVISVIPVVGDFAAAQQPVIVVLSAGTHLSVQAVVSSDRRFVRLTVVPFFSTIGAVNTFTFTGSSSSTATSSSDGPSDASTASSQSATTQSQGTTVQLPTFAFQTVTTTVSVPDGGTVLLGGIKRLSEQRLENGVPILNKIPYINRLFNNIGTGRSTSSLMMMVTPRIIIQEEEEAALGVQPGT